MTVTVVKRKFTIIKFSNSQEGKPTLSTSVNPEREKINTQYTLHIADQKNILFSLDSYHSYMSCL